MNFFSFKKTPAVVMQQRRKALTDILAVIRRTEGTTFIESMKFQKIDPMRFTDDQVNNTLSQLKKLVK